MDKIMVFVGIILNFAYIDRVWWQAFPDSVLKLSFSFSTHLLNSFLSIFWCFLLLPKFQDNFLTILCYFAGQEFNLVRSFTVAAASSPTSLLSPQLTALKGEFIQQLHACLLSPQLTALKGEFIQQLHAGLVSPRLTTLKGGFTCWSSMSLLSPFLNILKGDFIQRSPTRFSILFCLTGKVNTMITNECIITEAQCLKEWAHKFNEQIFYYHRNSLP